MKSETINQQMQPHTWNIQKLKDIFVLGEKTKH